MYMYIAVIRYGITAIYHRLEHLMWLTTSKAFYYESRGGGKEHNIAQVGVKKSRGLSDYSRM